MKSYVSVVIPAHNEQQHIGACIDSLLQQDYGLDNFEIIIVDNNSTDNTKNIINQYPFAKYYFKLDGPVGAVRNYGAELAKGEIIAFIDADCLAPCSWISSGITILSNSDADVIGGKYDLPEKPSWLERFWLLGTKEKKSTNLDLIGGSIFIKNDHFRSVGGFNEILTSGEDSKLAHDLRKLGLNVAIKKRINVKHLGNAKTIRTFLLRQAWHSENYISNLSVSIKDPTFMLIVLFISTIFLNIYFIVTNNTYGIMTSTFFSVILPSILSVKRIARADLKPSLYQLPIIYLIDLLYILGRIIGIIRGLKNSFFS